MSLKNFIVFLIILIFGFLNIQCKKNNTKDEINSIPINVSFDRFDKKFYDIDSFKLKDLKREYYYLFPDSFDDKVWINRRKVRLNSRTRERRQFKY